MSVLVCGFIIKKIVSRDDPDDKKHPPTPSPAVGVLINNGINVTNITYGTTPSKETTLFGSLLKAIGIGAIGLGGFALTKLIPEEFITKVA